MKSLTNVVLKHRLLVALAWIVVAVAGAATAPTTVDRLSFEFALPGQAAYETNEKIIEQFGGGGLNDPLLFVITGDGAAERADAVADAAREAVPGTRTVTPSDEGADVLAVDTTVRGGRRLPAGRSPALIRTPQPRRLSRRSPRAPRPTGPRSRSAGSACWRRGAAVTAASCSRSCSAGSVPCSCWPWSSGRCWPACPLLVAAVSILGTFLALLGLTYADRRVGRGRVPGRADRPGRGHRLLAAGGHSLARGERQGRQQRRRRTIAMATAGHSVLFSGVTVAVSLAALVLVPVPVLRSIGLGGLLIPLFSVAISLTLVPALLSAVGPKLNWPRRKPAVTRSRLWAAIATRVLRRRWLTVIGSVGRAPRAGRAGVDPDAGNTAAQRHRHRLAGIAGADHRRRGRTARRRGAPHRDRSSPRATPRPPSTSSTHSTVSPPLSHPGGRMARRRSGPPAGLDRRRPVQRRRPRHVGTHPRPGRRRRRRRGGRDSRRGRRLHLRRLRQRHLGRARASPSSPSCCSPAPCARCGCRSRRSRSTCSRSRPRTASRCYLAERLRIRPDLRTVRLRGHHDLGADRCVRVPLRAVHGLRGLPPLSHAGGVRPAHVTRRRASGSTSAPQPTARSSKASPTPAAWSPRPRSSCSSPSSRCPPSRRWRSRSWRPRWRWASRSTH